MHPTRSTPVLESRLHRQSVRAILRIDKGVDVPRAMPVPVVVVGSDRFPDDVAKYGTEQHVGKIVFSLINAAPANQPTQHVNRNTGLPAIILFRHAADREQAARMK